MASGLVVGSGDVGSFNLKIMATGVVESPDIKYWGNASIFKAGVLSHL
jgi:hypothetical protein